VFHVVVVLRDQKSDEVHRTHTSLISLCTTIHGRCILCQGDITESQRADTRCASALAGIRGRLERRWRQSCEWK
jgi:hypothetical protein